MSSLEKIQTTGDQFHIRSQKVWIHNAWNAFCVAFWGACVFLVAYFSRFSFESMLLTTLLFGWLIYTAFILVVHEASHGILFIRSNGKSICWLNRLFGWMICLPLGVHFRNEWEKGHLIHHRAPLRETDPQNCRAWTGRKLYRKLALTLLVPGYAQWNSLSRESTAAPFQCTQATSPTSFVRISSTAFWVLIFMLGFSFDRIEIPLALFLSIQVATALNLIKVALEHGGETHLKADHRLRSRTSLFWGKAFILPLNIGYHFEHHLCMLIPWYRLGEFHRAIVGELEPQVRAQIYFPNPRVGKEVLDVPAKRASQAL